MRPLRSETRCTKCLIIAAGKSSRLRRNGDSKLLIPILGIPLIERVIRNTLEAGVNDFYVVTGCQGEHMFAFLDHLSDRLGIRITTVVNEDWDKENGLSVFKAREYLPESFLLLMADHLVDPSIVRELMQLRLTEGEIILGVDGNIHNPLVDMEDVTRVKTRAGKIHHIGKGLTDFKGFDTGIFLCTQAIFDAVERCVEEYGDTSLSGAVQLLANEGRANAFDVGGRFWIDVDDPAALKRAENALLTKLRGKPTDGPVSRYLNRPLSVKISRWLVNYPVTPNQISIFSFLSSIVAAGLFTLGSYPTLLLGGIVAQFASVIDGCDGEIARLKFQRSDYGGWLDAALDRYADAFLLFGLAWYLYSLQPQDWVLLIGFLAIIGSFMVSYTADKADELIRQRIDAGVIPGPRIGRDLRVLLIFLGALSNQVLLALVIIALIMNLETLRRMLVYRTDG